MATQDSTQQRRLAVEPIRAALFAGLLSYAEIARLSEVAAGLPDLPKAAVPIHPTCETDTLAHMLHALRALDALVDDPADFAF